MSKIFILACLAEDGGSSGDDNSFPVETPTPDGSENVDPSDKKIDSGHLEVGSGDVKVGSGDGNTGLGEFLKEEKRGRNPCYPGQYYLGGECAYTCTSFFVPDKDGVCV
ncbi:hypothetical protein HELRODRAFT_184159 [Helobdella robusta]|uniref:Uncharacterized protein n=1 Tax=Helobdella robusta TaxID=6412 RepID=T1FKP5_HELRO|nr:hypothetical protein HELRODRAFT_184159 [Helobdella robusta]ESO07057.1 hypothetical protein HELRODRAFT_184159 [Helobdella robusta]